MRRHTRRIFRSYRLSSCQARRPLRRLDGFECLWRVRKRLPGDPEHRPDRRPAHQVLTNSTDPAAGGRAAFAEEFLGAELANSKTESAARLMTGKPGVTTKRARSRWIMTRSPSNF